MFYITKHFEISLASHETETVTVISIKFESNLKMYIEVTKYSLQTHTW